MQRMSQESCFDVEYEYLISWALVTTTTRKQSGGPPGTDDASLFSSSFAEDGVLMTGTKRPYFARHPGDVCWVIKIWEPGDLTYNHLAGFLVYESRSIWSLFPIIGYDLVLPEEPGCLYAPYSCGCFPSSVNLQSWENPTALVIEPINC